MATSKKWVIVLVICSGAFCATCASSVVRAIMPLVSDSGELKHKLIVMLYLCRPVLQKVASDGTFMSVRK